MKGLLLAVLAMMPFTLSLPAHAVSYSTGDVVYDFGDTVEVGSSTGNITGPGTYLLNVVTLTSLDYAGKPAHDRFEMDGTLSNTLTLAGFGSTSYALDYRYIVEPARGYEILTITPSSFDFGGYNFAVELNEAVTSTAQSFNLMVDVTGSGIASAVPEPSTWAMMILGFCGIGAMTYRRRKGAALAG